MTELIIIFNLFILETLLSIDNAAVLAIMVKDLPVTERPKALKYGLLGAFVFRGICLVLAAWLIKILWLKIAGGLYLIWLFIKHFVLTEKESGTPAVYRIFKLNRFWSTVIMVEVMDLAFSLDNVFAAVALTNNIWLIMIGVFVGIVSMRFIAQQFAGLMIKYPSLTNSAFTVIFLLGLKLVVAGSLDYSRNEYAKAVINSHGFDLIFSCLLMLIFFIPLLKTKAQSA
jgi:YkoY family integral membrane protein